MNKLLIVTLVLLAVGITSSMFTVYSYLVRHEPDDSIYDLYLPSNYAQMTIVRLDRTISQQPTTFVDVSNNMTIPKLQESIAQVGTKYDAMLKECNNKTGIEGYCDDLPINAIFTTDVNANEFQAINKIVQLKPFGIYGNNTWFSNLKYHHEGCFPLSSGFQMDSSKSDNYCYFRIIMEKR